MELLDRYLQAVKKHLPSARQDDIIAELRANLESQLEDREAALGRPLTQAEAETWLKELGAPIQMAARYQPAQYLIGPAVFPIFRHVIKLACTWGFIIYSVAKAAETLNAPNPSVESLVGYLLGLPMLFFNIVAWVTLVFAGFEFAVAQRWVPASWPPQGAGWDPSNLPPFEPPAIGGKKPRTYMQATVELVFGILGLSWLLLLPHNLWLLFGPGAAYLEASPYRLSPAFVTFYWCVVVLNAVHLGLKAHNLLRGRWQNPPAWQRFLREVFALIPLAPLLAIPGHAFVLLKHPELDQARLGAGVDQFNRGIYWFLLFICTITLMQLVWGLGKLGMNALREREVAVR